MKIQLVLLILGLTSGTFTAVSKISPSVWKHISKNASVNILISFKESDLESIRGSITSQSFATRTQRIQALYNSLKTHADSTQAQVLKALEGSKARKNSIQVNQLWITNQISVNGADLTLLQELDKFSEISSIEKEKIIPSVQPTESKVVPKAELQAGEQWGVLRVEAPEVWQSGIRGAGAVIAIVATGVRETHEALINGYRQQNGWYDPARKTDSPNDDRGVGTVVAGVIAGRLKGIGVAPEAQWIACKGCISFTCSTSDLLACGQWALCPTDSRGLDVCCDLAPSAVTNAWSSQSDFYEEVLKTLEVAGIASIFAAGSYGPGCGTIGYPGDSVKSIAVTSTEISNNGSSPWTAGPAEDGNIKPDLSAPGSYILSAWHTADKGYVGMSGTFVAAAHVSGVIALLKSKQPEASLEKIKEALLNGAQPIVPTGQNCGGIDDSIFPNNHAGYGVVNARVSVALLS
ncbi:unnamed protein product [Allacma fusca]|uniref:Peptidase S8/S53 domain-containing protein n=1 Tax=Allacma fusca TaxID=39272 RepID=A0A8J2LFB2_9HEXA|nr:unnamed protein product [Allacma fusca]